MAHTEATKGPWHLDEKGDPRGADGEPIYLTPANAKLIVESWAMASTLRRFLSVNHIGAPSYSDVATEARAILCRLT